MKSRLRRLLALLATAVAGLTFTATPAAASLTFTRQRTTSRTEE